MNYLSVCSGIEAATVAWKPLGWTPVAFSEIEKFPSAVLAYHWSDVPNLGDMTNYENWTITQRINILVGGTPCQAFSVAGLREGLADPRGNLTLTFLAMAEKFNPKWIVWENVPGVLSDKTNAFGQFLSGLGQLGYEYAYRVLDAQYYGVAQRRKRVFVVAHFGKDGSAAKVLFEPESLQGHPAPSREAWEGSATNAGGSTKPTVIDRAAFNQVVNALYDPKIAESETMETLVARGPHAVAHRMLAFGEYADDQTASTIKARDYKDATDLVAYGIKATAIDRKPENGGNVLGISEEISDTLTAMDKHAVAFDLYNHSLSDVNQTLRTGTDADHFGSVFKSMMVRRLTPIECERLQGFPDDHTRIPWRKKDASECPDGPRYKACGNSMAVPVMAWIGQRIAMVEGAKV